MDKTEKREPLKEKTQEVVNQMVLSSDHKKKRKTNGFINIATPSIAHAHEKLRELTGSGKAFKKEVSKTCKPKDNGQGKKVLHSDKFLFMQAGATGTGSINHQKIAKLLLNNQENNFIDKKLKEMPGQ